MFLHGSLFFMPKRLHFLLKKGIMDAEESKKNCVRADADPQRPRNGKEHRFMKNWKKLLACLLVGLMALTVFTACDASVGAPMGPKRSTAESAKALCESFEGVTYDEELSNKAYYIAYWVAQSAVSCKVNAEKTELSRENNIGNDAKALLQMENPRYASAFDCMGIGKGIGGGMGVDDFTPGFAIQPDPNSQNFNTTSDITFVLPNDGRVTDTMTKAAKGKTKLGVAYVVEKGVSYAVVLFG